MKTIKVRIAGMIFSVLDVGPVRSGYVMVLFLNWAHLRYHVEDVEILANPDPLISISY